MTGLMNAFASNMVAGSTTWNLTSFLKGATSSIEGWIALAVTLVGLVAVGYAIWIITTGLMSQGKKQTNWAIAIILLIFGGALSASGGFRFVRGIAESGQSTINELGSGKGGTISLLDYAQVFTSMF